MRRTIGAALAALVAAGGYSTAIAQEPDRGVSVAERVFDDDERDSRFVTIPRGTDIPVTLDEDIAIARDNLGEAFEGHITRDVEVNGETVLVAGAPAEVKLVESDRPEAATLRLSKVHINGDMRSVSTEPAEVDTEEEGWSTRKKAAAGAAAGAIVGAVTGAGVLEGAVVGAGGGLAWGLLDGDQARQVDDDTPLRFSLEEEVRLD